MGWKSDKTLKGVCRFNALPHLCCGICLDEEITILKELLFTPASAVLKRAAWDLYDTSCFLFVMQELIGLAFSKMCPFLFFVLFYPGTQWDLASVLSWSTMGLGWIFQSVLTFCSLVGQQQSCKAQPEEKWEGKKGMSGQNLTSFLFICCFECFWKVTKKPFGNHKPACVMRHPNVLH